jgi:hypothetical protein
MANQPSGNALPNRVTLYRRVAAWDVDGGIDGTVNPYPVALATNVACNVQPISSYLEQYDDDRRPTQATMYHVYFLRDYELRLMDRIDWIDSEGVVHNLYVDGDRDMTGRGRAFAVPATERL